MVIGQKICSTYLKGNTLLCGKVLIVENDPAWQDIYIELCDELDFEIYTAVSYGEARGWLRHKNYDLVIVDLNLASSLSPRENLDGFHLLRLTHDYGISTIVVSALAEPSRIDRAYEQFDIFAFIDKGGFRRDGFIQLMREVVEGGHTISADSPLNDLTARQLEVLELLVQGKTNREIAADLCVTPYTINKHLRTIFKKLDVNNRASAAAIAVKYGIRR